MSRHFPPPFDPRFAQTAWAGADWDEPEAIRPWFEHGRRGRHGRGEGDCPPDWRDDFRARRGDIKFILLELLSEQSRHGYDLIKAMETRFGGFRRLSPGSVYPTLQLLEDGGYLTSEVDSGKRVYTITEAGRELLAERGEHRSLPGAEMDEARQEFVELRRVEMELAGAVKQVVRNGNVDRIRRVRDLLEQMKRQIYAILSEE